MKISTESKERCDQLTWFEKDQALRVQDQEDAEDTAHQVPSIWKKKHGDNNNYDDGVVTK